MTISTFLSGESKVFEFISSRAHSRISKTSSASTAFKGVALVVISKVHSKSSFSERDPKLEEPISVVLGWRA